MYDAYERETHITTNDESDKWEVFTRQRKVINKLIKNGFEPTNVELEGDKVVSCSFHLDLNKISFKKAIVTKREYTEEQKEEIRQRLMNARNK